MSKPIPPRDFATNTVAQPDACPGPLTLAEGADADLAGEGAVPADPVAAPAAPPAAASATDAAGPLAFDPVPVAPRINGWTAQRQRLFIRALAETASVADPVTVAQAELPALVHQADLRGYDLHDGFAMLP